MIKILKYNHTLDQFLVTKNTEDSLPGLVTVLFSVCPKVSNSEAAQVFIIILLENETQTDCKDLGPIEGREDGTQPRGEDCGDRDRHGEPA